MLCALSGGKLIQHMHHSHFHTIEMKTGEQMQVISTHHQMQYPFLLPKEDYTLIGWANNLSSYHWMNDEQNIESVEKEAEIVIYHKTKCLAIQTHPEQMHIDSPIVNYLNDLLVLFIKDNQNKTQAI